MKLKKVIYFLSFSCAAFSQENELETRILSAYHGLDELPRRANIFCGTDVAGEDGMPITFSSQINGETVAPNAFVVETSSGNFAIPLCATLRPAFEPLENRTVLLIGPFGTADSPPVSVEVVERLEDVAGNSLVGLKINSITALESGPSLVFAERFAPDQSGLEGECPGETEQAVLLTWEGGVTGPQSADLSEPQRAGMTILLENGDRVNPIHLGDDDPDNHVIACLTESSPAISVNVQAGLYYDPGDDANPETSVNVN